MSYLRIIPIIFVLLLLTGGCTPRRSYQVTVTNQTNWPLTVGLVKEGPPYERHLASAGQWAIESPIDTLPPWGIRIPPGKTADTSAQGAFPHGVELYLRVYRGEYSNAELMAMSAMGPDRLDITLFPGINEVIVRDVGTKLEFVRVRPIPR